MFYVKYVYLVIISVVLVGCGDSGIEDSGVPGTSNNNTNNDNSNNDESDTDVLGDDNKKTKQDVQTNFSDPEVRMSHLNRARPVRCEEMINEYGIENLSSTGQEIAQQMIEDERLLFFESQNSQVSEPYSDNYMEWGYSVKSENINYWATVTSYNNEFNHFYTLYGDTWVHSPNNIDIANDYMRGYGYYNFDNEYYYYGPTHQCGTSDMTHATITVKSTGEVITREMIGSGPGAIARFPTAYWILNFSYNKNDKETTVTERMGALYVQQYNIDKFKQIIASGHKDLTIDLCFGDTTTPCSPNHPRFVKTVEKSIVRQINSTLILE